METPTYLVIELRVGMPLHGAGTASACLSEAHKLVGDLQGAASLRSATLVIDEVRLGAE